MPLDILSDILPITPLPRAYTLREIIFSALPWRKEEAMVIRGHVDENIIEIRLPQLRHIIYQLVKRIEAKGIRAGDTVLLASFYSSNELANALLFAALSCMGVRIFIPIYPEAADFKEWHARTGFKAVIMPYQEIQMKAGHDREKDAIHQFTALCQENGLPFWDAYAAFDVHRLLLDKKISSPLPNDFLPHVLSPDDEAVIFTTSGTSGKSKLVVYTQGSFSLSCQSWQRAGLFAPDVCGNPGFTPLFTHTIGIRHFVNALWTGQPACIMVISWFMEKPECARYLLLQMKPGHIAGGTAMFNTLLEFFRQFPELKNAMRHSLRAAIAIGAPFNPQTAQQMKSALGLQLFNGFGTTETQMVLLNTVKTDNEENMGSLGRPLPGVVVRLVETEREGIYELLLHAPYQCYRILGEEAYTEFFTTGDLVSYDNHGILQYVQRKGADFIKDAFGVKVPLAQLQEYYDWLYTIAAHIEWLPLNNRPGLAALIFLHHECNDLPSTQVMDWIKTRNDQLQLILQPFEFTHRHLERISIEKKEVPKTRKGTVSKKEINTLYEEVINKLKNPYVEEPSIERTEADEQSLLYRFADPRLASFLEALRLNVQFDEAEKDWLYYKKNGEKIAVLDMVGGFGAGLTGHNHPAIQEAITAFLQSRRPAINSQGSQHYYPSRLAAALNKLFARQTGRMFKVLLANTGAEAVEMALHHAYFAWWLRLEKYRDEQLQRFGSVDEIDVAKSWERNMQIAAKTITSAVVINNCFHGYSAGARSLLNNKKQRSLFAGLLKITPLHVNDQGDNWEEQLSAHLDKSTFTIHVVAKENGRYTLKPEKYSTVIASIVEPLRGEGGIYETNESLIRYLSTLSFPLIADEIQCGLGRTGTLPACPHAHYYLLGKSLGGGYEKIAAVLIDDNQFKPAFPQYYVSTFANGEMASCAALQMLDLIEKEEYAATAADKGRRFLHKLNGIAEKFPDIIESVRGQGLMIGVHFNKQMGEDNIFLRVLCENDLLGYLLAGWLFHNKQIRVLPSLSKPDSIRLEPSVYISNEQMDRVCHGLDELCQICRDKQIYALLRYLMNDDPYKDRPPRKMEGLFPTAIESPTPYAKKVGFIGNFTMPVKELCFIEPDLMNASDTGLRILFNKLQLLLEGKPIRLFSKNIMRDTVHFTFYILPFDTAHLETVHRWGKKRFYIAKIQEAVNRLVKEGVSHISLGAHTSILTGNGLYLAEHSGTKILTGNTMTVASALYHAEHYIAQIAARNPHLVIAIAGANGNIGAGLAGCFAGEKYKNHTLLLLGNNAKKLEKVRNAYFEPAQCVQCSTDLFELKQADIIISCTNTNDPIIFPHHIHAEKNVFIIDMAVPASVSDDVKQLPQVTFSKDASTMYLPDDPFFSISTHTPVGKVFCCAAEVMLAALYELQTPLKGHIRPASIKAMMNLGIRENMFNTPAYASLV